MNDSPTIHNVRLPYGDHHSVCPGCTEALPNDQFSDHPTSKGLCRACELEDKERQAKQEKNDEVDFAMKQLVATLRGSKIDAPHISELCEKIVKEFDGLDGLAKLYRQQVEAAIAKKPGGKTVIDSMGAIFKLIAESTKHRKSAPDLSELSDEVIFETLRGIMESPCDRLPSLNESN